LDVDALDGFSLLRTLRPTLATVIVVIACVEFPQQTIAVVINAAEHRVAPLAKAVEASFTAQQRHHKRRAH
jgi:hypothetical protein